MSEKLMPPGEHNDDMDRAPLQVDGYGIKVRGRVRKDTEDESRPGTWAEAFSRINRHLMTICERVFGFVADTLVAASKMVRDIGRIPVAFNTRIARAHAQADERESQQQDVVVGEKALSSGASTDIIPLENSLSLEGKLRDLQAKGFVVELVRLEDGTWGIIVVRPGIVDQARHLLRLESEQISAEQRIDSEASDLEERVRMAIRRELGDRQIRGDIQVRMTEDSLILEGTLASYYAKQLAQHAALSVLSHEWSTRLVNSIKVE